MDNEKVVVLFNMYRIYFTKWMES